MQNTDDAGAEIAFGNAVGRLVQHGAHLANRVAEAHEGAKGLTDELCDQHGLAAARRYVREHMDELIADLLTAGSAAQSMGGELALGITQEMVVEVVGKSVEIVDAAGNARPVIEGGGDGQG